MNKLIILTILFFSTFQLSNAQTEPASNPTDFEVSNNLTYKFNIKYQDAEDSDGYLVLRSGTAVTDEPVDGVEYLKGERIGDAKVFYVGGLSGLSIGIREVVANTTYHFAVYSFNDGATINYKQSDPLTAEVLSGNANFGNYYNGVDFTATNVISQITDLINPHIAIDYGQFDENIVANFFEKDTVVGGMGMKYINCQYSNEPRVYSGTFAFTNPLPSYSREHRMAFSWINFQGITRDDFEETPEGNDIHSLDLVNNTVNSSRSNHSFGTINGNPWSNSYLDFVIGTATNGDVVVAPRPDRQGDIARALYYMMVCYNNQYGENWGMDNLLTKADEQVLSELKAWHEADPPDAFEIARHEFVVSIQNNRNPFIDFPQLVDCIDFSDLTKIANCDVSVGIGELVNSHSINLYPNPVNTVLQISGTEQYDIVEYKILNVLGQVLQSNVSFSSNIDVSTIENGSYFLHLMDENNASYVVPFVK